VLPVTRHKWGSANQHTRWYSVYLTRRDGRLSWQVTGYIPKWGPFTRPQTVTHPSHRYRQLQQLYHAWDQSNLPTRRTYSRSCNDEKWVRMIDCFLLAESLALNLDNWYRSQFPPQLSELSGSLQHDFMVISRPMLTFRERCTDAKCQYTVSTKKWTS